MKIIRINKDGSMNEIDIKCSTNLTSILTKNSNSKGDGKNKELYSWKYENNTVKCYGWYDGYAGFENKHDLPPNGHSIFLEEDSSSKLLFGDLFILLLDNKDKLKEFSVSDYSCFYEFINEGFDNCDSDDDSIIHDDETNNDKKFINDYSDSDEEYNNDDDDDDDDIAYNEDLDDEELLDNDLNEY